MTVFWKFLSIFLTFPRITVPRTAGSINSFAGHGGRAPPAWSTITVDVEPRIEFGFDFSALCRMRGRGSPRFAVTRRPLGSKKSKRPAVSHRRKGVSCISALSTNNEYRRWSSPNFTTPGVQAIPRLVLACYYPPSCTLPSVQHIFRARPRGLVLSLVSWQIGGQIPRWFSQQALWSISQ